MFANNIMRDAELDVATFTAVTEAEAAADAAEKRLRTAFDHLPNAIKNMMMGARLELAKLRIEYAEETIKVGVKFRMDDAR